MNDHSVRCFLFHLCRCWFLATADFVIFAVVVPAGPEAEAAQEQLLHLHFEALAEYVVNHGIVDRGALGKHARQEADFRWDAATVFEDRPQTYQAVWGPAAPKADTYQNSNLQGSRRKESVKALPDAAHNHT